MKQPIPSNSTDPLKVGDLVQILLQWQDPDDNSYERLVIEAPDDCSRVLVQTLIPGFLIQPTEWIEADKLVHHP